jgi:saccharopine dehydrogenase-like NADP-dependent oxidoreductase
VSALKFRQNPLFEQIVIADAVPLRARKLADRLDDRRVRAIPLDARNQGDVARALRETGSTLLLNAALPATNLTLMRACLEAGCDYMDLASGGTDADGVPKLDDQFELDAAFRSAGRLALLGIGADPGTTNIYAAYIAKHLLDEVLELRVRDGDDSDGDGDGGFIAAFNPWVFIDECLCPATVYREGRFLEVEPLTGAEAFDFPELGKLTCYNVDHEETKTLPLFFPRLRQADFKIHLGDATLETLRVLQRLGLGSKHAVQVDGQRVVPRSVVVALLPQPADLAGKLHGRSCVGTVGRGRKDGEDHSVYVYSVADHERAYAELGVQATAYQTGIPPVVAAELIAEGVWEESGVLVPEELDPDPFLERLPHAGMAWQVRKEVVRVPEGATRSQEHAPPRVARLQYA